MAHETGLSEGVLFGMGNPLLDISAIVGEEFLDKYNLKKDNAILASKEHLPICKELIDNFEVDYLVGGAAQNTIRTVQWFSEQPGVTSYIGCVGIDDNADKLRGIMGKEGNLVHYMTSDTEPTGTCAVLVNGKNRSLVANIAAANSYSIEHLRKPENWALVERASYYYIAGFFHTVSPESILTVAKHAAEKGKVFSMNLSADFLCQFFLKPLTETIHYADFVFGNCLEYKTFAEHSGWGTEISLKEIGLKIAALPKAGAGKRERCVVLTQSVDPVIIAYKGDTQEHAVPPLDQSLIVDSNSAGDAFVGGFLFQLMQGRELNECVSCGCYAARTILQMCGCSFPSSPNF